MGFARPSALVQLGIQRLARKRRALARCGFALRR
jgi:hypothetical protein